MSNNAEAPIAVEESITHYHESKSNSDSASNTVGGLVIAPTASAIVLHTPTNESNKSNYRSKPHRSLYDDLKDEEAKKEHARVDNLLEQIDQKSDVVEATLDDKSYDDIDDSSESSVHDSEESFGDPPRPEGLSDNDFQAKSSCSSGKSNRRLNCQAKDS